jgi:hypothetical protein
VCSPITALPLTQPYELHNWWYKGPLTIHEWTYSGQEVSGPCLSPQDGQTPVAVPERHASATFDCDADFGPYSPFQPPPNQTAAPRPASITLNAYANRPCPSSAFTGNLRDAAKASLRGGETIVLCGSVSQPVPAGGALVLAQEQPTKANGKPTGHWTTFEVARTAGSGRYTASHRFRFPTKSPTHYSMRTVIPRQAGYPYLGNTSRMVSITIGGRG